VKEVSFDECVVLCCAVLCRYPYLIAHPEVHIHIRCYELYTKVSRADRFKVRILVLFLVKLVILVICAFLRDVS
jgi:hypothetical protein